jgi:hypothetical protein
MVTATKTSGSTTEPLVLAALPASAGANTAPARTVISPGSESAANSAKFPTGNFADSGLGGASEGTKSVSYGPFPTHPNREFFAALQGIKSGDQVNFRPDQGIPLSSAILGPLPCRKSDRPDRSQTLPRRRKGRRQMLEVAEADLELQLCPCEAASGMPQIARRARRRGTIGVPGLHDGAWSRRARPRCTELTVTGDRGFESSSLQRRVVCPDRRHR